jgi:hypothetical protein
MPAFRARALAGVLLAALVIAAAGCEDGSEAETPLPTAAGAVRDAAARTLAAGPAAIRIRVSSATAAYSLRGAIELATETFRVRARITRAPRTHFARQVKIIGLDSETFQIVDRNLGFEDIGRAGCAFDPHALIGILGGAASIQEAVALLGVATRLLRDAPRDATLLERRARSATYRVAVDPRAVSRRDSSRGDEWIVVNPPRLARHLAPVRVRVGSDGLIRRLSLELRRFPPPSLGLGLAREHRRERVSISVSLSDFGRALEVKLPSCVAME